MDEKYISKTIKQYHELRNEMTYPRKALWGEEISNHLQVKSDYLETRSRLQNISDKLFDQLNKIKQQKKESNPICMPKKTEILKLLTWQQIIDKSLEGQNASKKNTFMKSNNKNEAERIYATHSFEFM